MTDSNEGKWLTRRPGNDIEEIVEEEKTNQAIQTEPINY